MDHIALAIAGALGALSVFGSQWVKISKDERTSGKRKLIRFFSFVVLLCFLTSLSLNWIAANRTARIQTHRAKLEADREKRQAAQSEAMLNKLELIEQNDEQRLAKKYPHGYVVFGGEGGDFARLPFREKFIGGLRLDVTANWSKAVIRPVAEGWMSAQIVLPHIRWATIDENQNQVGSVHETYTTSIMPRVKTGHGVRVRDYPGEINCYLELLDPDAPAFVLGFKRQGLNEPTPIQDVVIHDDDPVFQNEDIPRAMAALNKAAAKMGGKVTVIPH